MSVAIGASVGTTEFYICKHKASSSLILPDITSKWLELKAKILGSKPNNLYNQIQVKITTVDQVVKENSIKSIFLLKIDTEGAELDVIKGCVKSLQLGIIKNIQLESHSNDLRHDSKLEILSLHSNYTHQKSIKHYFGSFTEEFFSLTKVN